MSASTPLSLPYDFVTYTGTNLPSLSCRIIIISWVLTTHNIMQANSRYEIGMNSDYHKTCSKPNTSQISLGPNETCQKIHVTTYSVLPYSTTTPINRLSVANTPKVKSLYTSSGENQGLLKVLWTSAISVPIPIYTVHLLLWRKYGCHAANLSAKGRRGGKV